MPDNTSLLSDYTADVEAFFNKQSSVIINNKDKSHAAILISTLFSKAEKDVVIFTRHFDGDFYNKPSVRAEMLAAIDRGVNVRVLIQEEPHSLDLIEELRSRGTSNVHIYKCRDGSPASNNKVNFTVVDGMAYRLERDRASHEAYACANDPETARKILALYQSFESDHEKVGLVENN